MFVPLMVLGAPNEVIAGYVIPNTLLGLIAHSNLEVRMGFLERVIMGPGAHRLHHSSDLEKGNSNFGSALVLWDRLFGTYISPQERGSPARVGIESDSTPRTFVAQVLEPLKKAPI